MREIFNGIESLRLLNNILEFVDGGIKTIDGKEYIDGSYYEYSDHVVWAKYKCGTNTIVTEYTYLNEGEDKSIMSEDGRYYVAKIFNALIEPYYSYLMNVLNSNSDISVIVSQVYGTTTDYIIYYDNNIVEPNPNIIIGKYLQCKNKTFEPIKLYNAN